MKLLNVKTQDGEQAVKSLKWWKSTKDCNWKMVRNSSADINFR